MDADRFLAAVALAVFFAALSYGAGRLIGAVLVGMLRKKANTAELQALIDRRSQLERDFAARTGNLRKVMTEVDAEIKILVIRRKQAEYAKEKAAESPERIMRLVGQEVRGAQRHVALVINKYAKAAGGSKSAVDVAWATAQEVEVWAKSADDARVELGRRYPESQGFKVTSLVEPGAA